MNIEEISKILDGLPLGGTNYEFENFSLETIPTTARQLVSVLKDIEDLHIEKLKLEHSLSNKNFISAAEEWEKPRIKRSIAIIEHKLEQRYKWYQQIDPAIRDAILGEYEQQEHDYWANYLGKQAAIEILTIGRTSKETMEKMASLPVEAFEDAVSICVRFATLVKETTATVESNTSYTPPGLPEN